MSDEKIIAEVWVPGVPRTKGSMEHIGGGQMRESVQESSRWRALMAERIRADVRRRAAATGAGLGPATTGYWVDDLAQLTPVQVGTFEPYAGPVSVFCAFWLPRPRAVAAEDGDTAAIHGQSGDVDKLVRNVLDACGSTSRRPAMNGYAFRDDVQVVHLYANKYLADPTGPWHMTPGAYILVAREDPQVIARWHEVHAASVRRLQSGFTI